MAEGRGQGILGLLINTETPPAKYLVEERTVNYPNPGEDYYDDDYRYRQPLLPEGPRPEDGETDYRPGRRSARGVLLDRRGLYPGSPSNPYLPEGSASVLGRATNDPLRRGSLGAEGIPRVEVLRADDDRYRVPVLPPSAEDRRRRGCPGALPRYSRVGRKTGEGLNPLPLRAKYLIEITNPRRVPK